MIGKMMEYEVLVEGVPTIRRAKVTGVVRHEQLGDVFVGISPFGNEVKLTMREIKRVVNSKKKKK